MKSKYRFPELACRSCPYYRTVGTILHETRYCFCYPKKRQKRFKRSDPKYKAPKWCPRRKKNPILRVYHPASEMDAYLVQEARLRVDAKAQHVSIVEHRYALAHEETISINAKAFYEKTLSEPSEQLLDVPLEYGDIVEIDDGMTPYYFYYFKYGTFIVAPFFDRQKVRTEPAQ